MTPVWRGLAAAALTVATLWGGVDAAIHADQQVADSRPEPRAPAPPLGQPTFRAGVDLLVVEARVEGRGGQTPPDLDARDFLVEIDGRARRVVSAEFVDFSARGAVAVEDEGVTTNAPADDRRTLLLVVDQESLPASARTVLEAARRWVQSLPAGDRIGLVSLPPPGPRVEFTTSHARVVEALGRVVFALPNTASAALSGPAVSLWEAVRISEGDERALTDLLQRECPTGPDLNLCIQEVQNAANEIAADARTKTGPVLNMLRGVIEALGTLPGRKDLVMLTGGWVVPDQMLVPQMQDLARAAAASRVTIHGVLADTSSLAVSVARTRPGAPLASRDRYLLAQPVDTVAGMTGGASLQLVGTGDALFERIGQATSSYYRLGVEPESRDLDGRSHRLAVRVATRDLVVRDHRRVISAVRTNIDPTLTAAEALERVIRTPVSFTDLGLRVATEVVPESTEAGVARLAITVQLQRAAPGYATAQILVTDVEGRPVASTGREVDVDEAGTAAVFTTLALPAGRYDIRVAARDDDGRMGTVTHAVDALTHALGPYRTHGLVLFELREDAEVPVRPLVGPLWRDTTLIARFDTTREVPAETPVPVLFDVVATGHEGRGEVVLRESTTAQAVASGGWFAEAAIPASALPPGVYDVRATIKPGADEMHVTRSIRIADGTPRTVAARENVTALATVPTPTAASNATDRAMRGFTQPRIEPFDVTRLLDAAFVDVTLQRAASHGDAATRSSVTSRMQTGIDRLRTGDAEAAAGLFREALRAAPDFRPALAYLGACYAIGGSATQAAGAWQTAVLGERDNPAFYRLAIDGWLQAGRFSSALTLARDAVARWPDEPLFRRRLATALLADGAREDGLTAVLALDAGDPEVEGLLVSAMAHVYVAWQQGSPIRDAPQDLDAMRSLRARYPADGPRVALLDVWLHDMERRR